MLTKRSEASRNKDDIFLSRLSLQNRLNFLRILGIFKLLLYFTLLYFTLLYLQRRKRGERETSLKREEEREKITACTHTIVQGVPAFKYERGYLIGYLTWAKLK